MERIKFKPQTLPRVIRERGTFIAIPATRNTMTISKKCARLLGIKNGDLLEFEASDGEIFIRKTQDSSIGHVVKFTESDSRTDQPIVRTGYSGLARAIADTLKLPNTANRFDYTGRIQSGFYIFSQKQNN